MIRYKLASPEFFSTAQPPKCCLLLNVQLVSKYAPTNVGHSPVQLLYADSQQSDRSALMGNTSLGLHYTLALLS